MNSRVLICYFIATLIPVITVACYANGNSSQPPVFNTETKAVAAATDIYNPLSLEQDREFMGAILRIKDKYIYTVTAGIVGKDTVTIRIPRSSWSQVVAFWHTHGRAEHKNKYFSEVDTNLANKTGKPFYLADYTGALKVFRPGGKTLNRRKAAALGLPGQSGFSRGTQAFDDSNQMIKVNTLFGSRLELSNVSDKY